MEEKISIVLATYNGEKFLREQLNSILNQSIQFYELIITDDASTDGTCEIISEYASKDDRIKVLKSSCNSGLVRNFEKGLAAASGDLIAFSDQDDIWLPDHLEVLKSNIGDNAVCMGDSEIIDELGNRSNITLSYCENRDYIPEDSLEKAYSIFFYRGWLQGASMLIRKSILKDALPFPDINNYHDFWIGALACFNGGIRYVPHVITLYRRHSGAVTGMKERHSYIRTMIGHVLFSRALCDRPLLVKALKERLNTSLSKENILFLDKAEVFYKRRNTVIGRFRNFFFELNHRKLIYSRK